MDVHKVMRISTVLAAFAAGGAFAQSRTPVMTDVNPPPAEERDSVGAVVVESDMVVAQRQAFGTPRYTPAYVAAIGQEVLRVTRAEQLREELAQRREEKALHELGGPAAPPSR